MAFQDYFDQVQQLYIAFYQRPADPDGLYYWAQRLEAAGGSLEGIVDAFATSAEAVSLYDTNGDGELNGNDNMTALVTAIYQALFNRAPDAAGLQFYVDALTNGEFPDGRPATPGRVALDILNGAQNDDLIIVYNKTTAAMRFTETLDPGLDGQDYQATYAGDPDAQQGREYLNGVGVLVSSIPTQAETTQFIQDNVADPGDPILSQPSGQTFTLTAGADNIVGTNGNDTINGVVSATAGETTMTLADNINGGAGTDTFNLLVSGNVAMASSTISNVENFFIKNLTNANTAHDFANVTGAAQIWSNGSVTNFVATGIQNNVALGLQNTDKNYTATFKDGTFVAGSTVTIAANGAGNKTTTSIVTVGHAATAGSATDLTLAVSAVGGKNYLEYANGTNKVGDLKTITVSGDGFVSLTDGAGTEFDNVTTINASANTGGVEVSVGANNKDVTVTGGSGDDTFVLTNFNGNDKVDGGAGKDTLSISLGDALAFTKAADVTNFEVLKVTGNTGAASTLNADFFGVSNFVVDGTIGHDVTLNNLSNNGTVQINSDSGAAVNLTIDVKGAIAGTADTLTLTTDSTGADLATNAVTVKAGGVETINIVSSSDTGAGAFKVQTITDAQLKTVNISGKGDVVVNTISAAALQTVDASKAEGAVTIDASNSTSAVTFSGGAKVDTYTASSKGDTINGSKGADIYTLGTGNDVLFYTAADQSTATSKDTVGSFNVTADLIKFSANLQQGTANYLGSGAFTSSGSTELRMQGADLQVDLDGNGTADMVITLTGLTAADFGATNFTFA